MEFSNPTFDDTFLEGMGETTRLLESLENTLYEIGTEEERQHLNTRELKLYKISHESGAHRWRIGPAPIEQRVDIKDTKLAALQAKYELEKVEYVPFYIDKNLSTEEQNRTATAALINYFAFLSTTNESARADGTFLENLLLSADINATDEYGQSIMHEVAREWHTDFAYFLKIKGANIDAADHLGRTPLFVAAVSNHVKMVEWLIKNGADINHRTIAGQEQTVMHFAAKFDALEIFIFLMRFGADPLAFDARRRTPMFLAAEYGMARISSYMLKLGLPTCSYNDVGSCCIDHVVDKLPYNLAVDALDQFMVIDHALSNQRLYINCLGKKRWRLLRNLGSRYKELTIRPYDPPTPFDIIVKRKDLLLITHPIILELLTLKRQKFAFKYTVANIVAYLLFTLVWTTAISIRFSERTTTLIIILTIIGQLITILFLVKLVKEYVADKNYVRSEKKRIFEEIAKKEKFCHPRWKIEKSIQDEVSANAELLSVTFWKDGWNVIEATCLIMATGQTILTVLIALMKGNGDKDEKLRSYYSAVFVVVVWLRLNRSLRLIQSLGPFIAMLGECVIAIARFAFLFFEFFIPFSVAFWVLFGDVREGSAGGEYEKFNDMLYQLYLLTIVGDYDYTTLKAIDKLSSQVIVAAYLILVSIVSLNLFIALLSESVARVNEKASATAFLKEAEDIVSLEKIFPNLKKNFDAYANKHYAPKLIKLLRKTSTNISKPRDLIGGMYRTIQDMKNDMQSMTESHAEIKKDLETTMSKMREFQECYNDEKINEIWTLFESIFNFQTTKLNKLHRRTRERFHTTGKAVTRFINNQIFNMNDSDED